MATALTTPKQAPVIDSIPSAGMSDTQLQTWLAQNQGKVAYDATGTQVTIPQAGANAGTIRSWLNGSLKGLSQTDPTGATSAAGATAAGTAAAPATDASGTTTGQSYLTPSSTGTTSMASTSQAVTPDQAIAYYVAQGGSPNIDANSAIAYFTAMNPNYGASGVSAQDALSYYINQGGSPNVDPATAISFYEAAHPDEVSAGVAQSALQPEQIANQQMAAIDPASEALRTAVSGSYLPGLATAATGGPTADQLQSYLNTYQQLDPAGYAQRVALGQGVSDQVKQAQQYVTQVTGQAPTSATDALAKYKQLDPAGYASMTALGAAQDASLKQATDQLALGSQLDPVTQRQVEQATRAGQAARGNVYGTPQMVSEAMTTGQAGLALQAQRQAAAQNAEGSMQSYLTSGATPGAVGQAGYQQGLTNVQGALGLQGSALGQQQSYLQSGQTLGDTALGLYNQNQNSLLSQQQAALSYLGSGQTPYQAGASYVSAADAAAAAAAAGGSTTGTTYAPTPLATSYTGTAAQAPQYGLDVGAQATNWYNSLQSSTGTSAAPTKDKTVSAATGALSGAAAGATAGSVVPVYGTAIGAVVGGVAGGLGGYYS